MKKEDPPSLSLYNAHCLYFSMSRFQRRLNKLADECFAPLDMPPSHAILLIVLNERDKQTAGELAEIMVMSPSTITRFIDKLEQRQLCKRRHEGRTAYLSISEKGRKEVPKIQAAWKNLYNAYNDKYGAAEAKQLNDMIVKLNRKVGESI